MKDNLVNESGGLVNDCISRQAAIDAIEITPFDDYGDYMRARELIEQLPSAEPRHYHEENLLTYAHDMGVTLEQAKKELQKVTEQPETHDKRTETHACDLISRQAAIDEAYDLIIDNEVYRVVQVETLIGLPSAQPQRWIPMSERMPENGHYYLWCSNGGNVQSDYYWDGFENGQKYGYTIVAWMPLPKAYKGEEE